MTDNDFAMPTQLMDHATVSSSSPPTPDASPAVNTDTSISAQTSPLFTVCDFIFLQDISSADISLSTPVRTADVRPPTSSTAVFINKSTKPTSSSVLTGDSISPFSSAVIISNTNHRSRTTPPTKILSDHHCIGLLRRPPFAICSPRTLISQALHAVYVSKRR